MTKLNRFVVSFLREEDGASAAEYALLLAIISTGMAVAAGTLGEAIASAMNNGADCINDGLDCNS